MANQEKNQTKEDSSFDPVIYEDRNRNRLHSFIRIDDEEVAIVEDKEILEKLRFSALQSAEKERQRTASVFKVQRQSYRKLLEGELKRIMEIVEVDRRQAGSMLHKTLNLIKRDFADICLNGDGQFVPSQELIQEYVNKAIRAELIEQREEKEKL